LAISAKFDCEHFAVNVLSCAPIFALLLYATNAQAGGPSLPCSGEADVGYPAVAAAPVITIWHAGDIKNWPVPACTGWQANSHSKLVITLKGSFRFDGTMNALLARIGAVSSLPSVMYWSVTDSHWNPLAYAASALSSPNAKDRRSDFSATDFVKGAELYYWEDDTRSGDTVYRLKVLESAPERAVIASDNVTPIRRFLITLFEPGALQSVLFVQRLSHGVYGAFIINRTGDGTSALAGGHDESYVNRANALFRQLAGTKTDQAPPAAR
jgi:hypothetical protein